MVPLTKSRGVILFAALCAVGPPAGGDEPAPPAPRSVEVGGFGHLALSPEGTFVVGTAYHAPTHSLGFGTRDVQLLAVEPHGKPGATVLRWNSWLAGGPWGVAIAPDGKRVAVTLYQVQSDQGGTRTVRTAEVGIWDAATGKRTATLTGSKADQLYGVTFSPDGKYVAAGGALLNKTAQPDGGGVIVWNVDTGDVVWSNLEHKALQGSVVFSPDGKFLATAGSDHTVRVWDALSGKPLKAIETPGYFLYSLSFSPDGKLLAGGASDGAVRVWDVAKGDEKHALKGYKNSKPNSEPLFAQFLPDGTLLTAGAAEKGDGSLKVWNADTGACVRALAEPNRSVWWLAVTTDGRTAVVGTHAPGTWQRESRLTVVPLAK